MNMNKICADWLEDAKYRCKASTCAVYGRIIRTRVVPLLGNMALRDVTLETVREFIDRTMRIGRLDRRGGLAPKTVRDITSVLLQILRFAGINIKTALPAAPEPELHLFSADEQARLVRFLRRGTTDPKRLGILLALFTGLRVGELCALTWGDIDMAAGTLRVSKAVQRVQTPGGPTKTTLHIGAPKSKASTRTIPLPEFLRRELKALWVDPQAYLLTGTAKCMEPRLMQGFFTRMLKQAGIAHKNFHALRHSFATRAVEQGFDIKSVSELLGHSNVKFTMESYVHSSLELKRAHMERMAALW